jgi:hypothetical protein
MRSPIISALHADARGAQRRGAVVAASLREKLIKIGAKVVSHSRYVTFQLAEVACHGKSSRKSWC